MSKNERWELLNKNELPRFESGTYKNKINHKACVGMTLIFKNINTNKIYEIRIIEYIKGSKENGKRIDPKFKIEYVYFKGTEYEEIISKSIDCCSLINNTQIGRIVPSLNQWRKENDYWIGTTTNGEEFKFSTDNKELEYNILHSTWYIGYRSKPYVQTGSLNNTVKQCSLHKLIAYDGNQKESNAGMCVDHKNADSLDNRKENLKIKTKQDNNKNRNTNNKFGLTSLQQAKSGSYYSKFSYNNKIIYTKYKKSLEEAKIDNLIAQRYLGYKHNEDQFYKLKSLSEERIKEVTDWLDERIEKNRNKIRKEKEYKYDFIEKSGYIGIRTFKKDGTENPVCWVDRNFVKEIRGDKIIVDGRISNNNNYFIYNINGKNCQIHNYVLINGTSLDKYKEYTFHIDHVNNNTNDNYKDNLEIVTNYSNQYNKERKVCYEIKSSKYKVKFGSAWKYFDLYIKDAKKYPIVDTIEEAEEIVRKRRDIINKYRFRVKTLKELDEVIDFSEKHKLDLDSAYIVCKGLDTLENIKNYLKAIDK